MTFVIIQSTIAEGRLPELPHGISKHFSDQNNRRPALVLSYEMAEIGKTPRGGCNRQALTDEDKQGRDLFVSWCRAAGCEITVDNMGNIFALRAGKNDSHPPVSGAGHDSVHVSSVAPTSMIFIPCEGGLSHNEAESAGKEDLEAGCNVLLHAILEMAAG